MKKVLLLIDNLDSGGAQNQMVLLAQGIKKSGYDLTVVTYFEGTSFFSSALNAHNIKHILIQKNDKLGIGFVLNLIKFIKENGFEIAVSFMNTPNSYLALCKFLFIPKLEIIISHRMKTELSRMSFIRKGLLKCVNNQANYIVCNSNHERLNWITHQRNVTDRISTIYNGVDQSRFSPPSTYRTLERKLLVVGSLSQYKNGLIILEAVKRLKESGVQNIQVHWIGRVDKHLKDRNQYAQTMFNYIEKHKLEDWISFDEPVIDIQNKYLNYDGLILASKSEGLPNVVCEALSTGLPVILSDVLDHPMLVEEGSEGFLFDADSADNLCVAIETFYKLDNDTYIKLQKNAVTKAKKLFSLKSYIDSYINLIEA
jgi:glycosyltransferase involved in cell wall biosynthesis